MGTEDFSNLGLSDVAAGVGRMAGANIVDGKYAVIRGLADRYFSIRSEATKDLLAPRDALAGSARHISNIVSARAMVCYTSSGSTANPRQLP